MLNFIKEYKKIEQQNKELIKQLKDRDNLLKHIAHRCDNYCGTNFYNNPSIGFRKIKELAKTFTNS